MVAISVSVYDIGLLLYFLAAIPASIFNAKARKWLAAQFISIKQIQELKQKKQPSIWVHCASLGEFEQGLPAIERLQEQYPDYRLVVSFFSPSGYNEVSKRGYNFETVYLPLDGRRKARRFIKAVQPKLVIFIKYEFWYHYLKHLKNQDIPILLVSGIFRKEDIFFKWYGELHKHMLKLFTHIFVQDQTSAELLYQKLLPCSVNGDTRFDRVLQVLKEPVEIPEVARFCKDNWVLIAGSTWPEDDKYLGQLINGYDNPKVRYIVAPHEISFNYIKSLERKLQQPSIRLSEIDENTDLESYKVLIVDSVGKLVHMYKYADIAYIGGGFGKGIHNTIEASANGLPVIMGPKYQRFREARDLVFNRAAFSVVEYKQLLDSVVWLTDNPLAYEQSSETALNYVKKNAGAADKVMDYIAKNKLL